MTLLQEGDVFELERGDKVYIDLPGHLWPSNYMRGNEVDPTLVCDWGLKQCEVEAGQQLRQGTADFMIGRYVVTSTSMDGGGTGHGRYDVYPDGHHVHAQHVEHPKLRISFYQSGAFTCMLPKKQAIGRARATWHVEAKSAS